jgi:hypothetical protein
MSWFGRKDKGMTFQEELEVARPLVHDAVVRLAELRRAVHRLRSARRGAAQGRS